MCAHPTFLTAEYYSSFSPASCDCTFMALMLERSVCLTGNRKRLSLLHGPPGACDEEQAEAVLRSGDARDWFLNKTDVSNISAQFVASQWKQASRDVESTYLWVRGSPLVCSFVGFVVSINS